MRLWRRVGVNVGGGKTDVVIEYIHDTVHLHHRTF